MDIHWLKWATQAVIGFIGGAVSYFALPKFFGDWWLAKINANHAKKLEALKTSLERSTFVTRAHFETEFAAMKEVSQCLAQVKILYRRLNPIEAGKELMGDALETCVNELGEANGKLLTKLEEYGVFLTPEIYDEFERCYNGASAEFDRLKEALDYPQDKTINAKHFWTSYSKVCQLIRERISSLAVIAGT